MIDLVKKSMLTGLGLASLTKDKIEEIVSDFVEKGKMTEQEGRKLAEDLLARSDESREELKAQIEDGVQKALDSMNLAKKSEVEALKKEVEELKKALGKGAD